MHIVKPPIKYVDEVNNTKLYKFIYTLYICITSLCTYVVILNSLKALTDNIFGSDDLIRFITLKLWKCLLKSVPATEA